MTEAEEKLLFDTPVNERWGAAYRQAGIDPRLLAPTAGLA